MNFKLLFYSIFLFQSFSSNALDQIKLKDAAKLWQDLCPSPKYATLTGFSKESCIGAQTENTLETIQLYNENLKSKKLLEQKKINNQLRALFEHNFISDTLLMFSLHFNDLINDIKDVKTAKKLIEDSPYYKSMLVITSTINDIINHLNLTPDFSNKSMKFFYSKNQSHYGLIEYKIDEKSLFIPYVCLLNNESKVDNLVFMPIQFNISMVFSSKKKVLEDFCFYARKRSANETLVGIYSGKYTNSPFSRSGQEILIRQDTKLFAEHNNFTEWNDKFYIKPLYNNDEEERGFFLEFNNYLSELSSLELTPLSIQASNMLLLEDHPENLVETVEQANELAEIIQQNPAIQQEWEKRKQEVINDELGKLPKKKTEKKTKKNKKSKNKGKNITKQLNVEELPQVQCRLNEEWKKLEQEVSERVSNGRQNFRQIREMLTLILGKANAHGCNINSNQQGSHIVLSREGRSPVTFVKLHGGKSLAPKQAKKLFKSIIELASEKNN
jgi:hypothetical protein